MAWEVVTFVNPYFFLSCKATRFLTADAGMEVIYLGLYQTPEMIARAAIEEDVDVIGISILSGAHLTLFSSIMALLKENNAEHISVIGGGIIPEDDMAPLTEMGVAKVFVPGSGLDEIVSFVQTLKTEG